MTADPATSSVGSRISIEAALLVVEGSRRDRLEIVHELLRQALDALDRSNTENDACIVLRFPQVR